MESRLEEHRTGMGLLGTTAALLAAAGSVLFLVLGTSAQVSAPGMEPGLLPGDRVYVLTSAYGRREPRPGEVAAFRLGVEAGRGFAPDRRPELPTQLGFGRILGMPGDEVEIRRRALRRNGERLLETRLPAGFVDRDGRQPALWEVRLDSRRFVVARHDERETELEATRVEAGRYLLLGDNRTRAYDGRYWGSLQQSDLLGPALLVLFSRDPESGRIRWNRIGRLVD